MARLIVFFLLALALAWAVVWVSDNPGQVSLNWGGWRIDISAGVLGAVVLAFAVAVALLYRLWLFLTRAPGRIGQAFKERRSQKGYKALTKGMVAVAAGDAEEARRQVGKADGLLGEPPLTLLLKAQAAQLNGDEKAAESFFTTMLEDPDMAFLGLRGLLNQAIKRGDDVKALELAERAQDLNPNSAWLADTVFDLQARAGRWLDAEQSLKPLAKLTGLPNGEVRHRHALALLGQSVAAEQTGDKMGDRGQALKLAEKALNEDPELTAAALHLTRLALAAGNTRKAKAQVEKAWALKPHPELAVLYFDAAGATDGMKKVAAAEKLLSLKPGHPDGHLAMAAAALEAQLWGEAKTHLEAAMEAGRATRGVYTLMARLAEEDRKDKDAARDWLARAASAPLDPAWVCGGCGHVDAHWAPHCPKCNAFDSLSWDTPPGTQALAEMDARKPAAKSVDARALAD